MRVYFFYFITLLSISSCKTYKPVTTYEDKFSAPIDYSNLDNWAAHAYKVDNADKTPDSLPQPSELHNVDVFFIHPTTCTGDKGQDKWNAEVNDPKLNKKTDEGTILFQASAFNQAGNVYAPRYRQAHLHCYFTKDQASAKKAFDFAYRDVKDAFVYFLNHLNQHKPFIIASHSQGTNHAERLIEEFIDNDENLKNRFVAAYLIGMPISKDRFKYITPCENEYDTGCYISWRTFKEGVDFPGDQSSILVTNPLSWDTSSKKVEKEKNPGSILRDFYGVKKGIVSAQVADGILWSNKPKFKGSFFFRTKNYHIADINFYYISIRENAVKRVGAFWKR